MWCGAPYSGALDALLAAGPGEELSAALADAEAEEWRAYDAAAAALADEFAAAIVRRCGRAGPSARSSVRLSVCLSGCLPWCAASAECGVHATHATTRCGGSRQSLVASCIVRDPSSVCGAASGVV